MCTQTLIISINCTECHNVCINMPHTRDHQFFFYTYHPVSPFISYTYIYIYIHFFFILNMHGMCMYVYVCTHIYVKMLIFLAPVVVVLINLVAYCTALVAELSSSAFALCPLCLLFFWILKCGEKNKRERDTVELLFRVILVKMRSFASSLMTHLFFGF